jgi:hypothetical protein
MVATLAKIAKAWRTIVKTHCYARTVKVLYKPKDQQGCQRWYTTSETLATMAMKCQRMRRVRMRSKDNLSCVRIASRYFSRHLLRDGSGTKWTV